jgi:hypothetical protein
VMVSLETRRVQDRAPFPAKSLRLNLHQRIRFWAITWLLVGCPRTAAWVDRRPSSP